MQTVAVSHIANDVWLSYFFKKVYSFLSAVSQFISLEVQQSHDIFNL